MIAEPSGWGRPQRVMPGALLAHVAGLVVGSGTVAVTLQLAGAAAGHPRPWMLGAAASLLAMFSLPSLPWLLEGSHWRVPRTWFQTGPARYAALFGLTLGTGFLTALSSPGYYVVAIWYLTAPDSLAALAVGGMFALGRAVPFAGICLAAGFGGRAPLDLVKRGEPMVATLRWAEYALLVVIAVLTLFG